MNLPPPITATDQECLTLLKRKRDPGALRTVVTRYLSFVYSSAFRRTSDPTRAAEVTRAVFLVLARRARQLRKRTVLAAWLFHVTAVTCRRAGVKPKRNWLGFLRERRVEFPPDTTLWARISGEIDAALERLPSKLRNAVLLMSVLHWPVETVASILRISEVRAQKRASVGLEKMARRLSRQNDSIDANSLAPALATESCAAPLPEGLLEEIVTAIEESAGRRPALKLARRTLNTLAWARWRRRFIIAVPGLVLVIALLIGIGWKISARDGHSQSIATFLIWSMRHKAKTSPEMAQPARPWPTNAEAAASVAGPIHSSDDLYQSTNIWLAHLKFSREQWKALEPKEIGALPHFIQKDGTVLLRHPDAKRSGLAGVLGFDFDWTHADFELAGREFTNVAARVKGNGTYLGSLYGLKRSMKVDLNKFSDGQKLGGMDEFNFHNMINDYSCLSDALACEFFRDAGVPSPRTAYAWLTVSVDNQWTNKPLGLFVMVEPVDADFARRWFGSKKAPVFKPVTYELFQHLGDHWSAYADIYDLKTQATPAQLQRVMDLARLVSHASDAEFASRISDYLDMDAFARFMAGQVLLSNYDSFLANGQNFYVYLNPRSNKLGFIPWDMDLAWGSFFLLGSTKQRERASIWHPWTGKNLFLERVMKVDEFRHLYRNHLEDFLARLFVFERLNQRIDELAGMIRGPVAAESDFRLRRFEGSLSEQKLDRNEGSARAGEEPPIHQIKLFLKERAKSVRAQLDGKSKGVILQRESR
jgi:DNA-directed RNA polymerase specialized sigma24 family protein